MPIPMGILSESSVEKLPIARQWSGPATTRLRQPQRKGYFYRLRFSTTRIPPTITEALSNKKTGVRLNLNKRSASVSIGGRGAHVTVRPGHKALATWAFPAPGCRVGNCICDARRMNCHYEFVYK